LIESAEVALRFWKIILPPASTLQKLVGSVAATGRQEIFERIATDLSDSTCKSLDALLEVAQGERQSGLMIFKDAGSLARRHSGLCRAVSVPPEGGDGRH
jgi:hypothetical protein